MNKYEDARYRGYAHAAPIPREHSVSQNSESLCLSETPVAALSFSLAERIAELSVNSGPRCVRVVSLSPAGGDGVPPRGMRRSENSGRNPRPLRFPSFARRGRGCSCHRPPPPDAPKSRHGRAPRVRRSPYWPLPRRQLRCNIEFFVLSPRSIVRRSSTRRLRSVPK